MILERDLERCQFVVSEKPNENERPVDELPREFNYPCVLCNGYDMDCPGYTPMENTP